MNDEVAYKDWDAMVLAFSLLWVSILDKQVNNFVGDYSSFLALLPSEYHSLFICQNNEVSKKNSAQGSSRDETGKPCQVEFGSYCLWSSEHKEVMKDTTVKRVKDQLFVARAYYPSVAKLKHQEKLSREMKQNIQEHERMLSEAISDADLPPL